MKSVLFYICLCMLILSCELNPYSGFEPIEKIKTKTTHEIASNNWTIGCEVLDRDYANYHFYKSYLDSLGCKTARIQAGWAKTENTKGRYNFAWLDTIVNDLAKRSIRPWMQFSYGNPIYPGGGDPSLAGGIPTSQEALTAWDKWVEASVLHFKNRINYYEIWNEPNLKNTTNPAEYARLYIRTAEIIRKFQPEARLSALAVAGIHPGYIKAFLEELKAKNKIHLVDEITYHPYNATPEYSYRQVDSILMFLPHYSSSITIKQGENGCPSTSKTSGALRNLPWDEKKQAKWFLRRMMSDAGRGIPSSVFTILDFEYPRGQHTTGWNMKGLLKADTITKKVAYKKPAYDIVRHITALFDSSLIPLKELSYSLDSSKVKKENRWLLQKKYNFSLFVFQHNPSGKQLFVVWMGGNKAFEKTDTSLIGIKFPKLMISEPVLFDLFSGTVYSMNSSKYKTTGNHIEFYNIPVSDYPVIIADKSFIHY